ncbi:hypothetical protein NL676_008054 [Syzygium grande]|nr:hypothetical protein NL676_008054 [Syzygium grande]
MDDQIVLRPTEVIVKIMLKDRVEWEIIPKGQRYKLPLSLTASTQLHHCHPLLLANRPSAILTEPGIMDENGNGGEINLVVDTGDQIVLEPMEEIVRIMDKDRVKEEIIREGDMGFMDKNGNGEEINPVGDTGDQIVSGPMEEIVRITDKDKVRKEIITKEDTGNQIEVIVEIMDKDRARGEIIPEEGTGD